MDLFRKTKINYYERGSIYVNFFVHALLQSNKMLKWNIKINPKNTYAYNNIDEKKINP